VVFVAGAALAGWVVWGRYAPGPAWLALPLGLFMALVIYHERVVRLLAQSRSRVRFYEMGLRRIDGTWPGHGEEGQAWCRTPHPYADDLDLFGRGSLFQLLCGARTRAGEETLARWLQEPAGADEVLARQKAVAELRPRVALREELALVGEALRRESTSPETATWGTGPPLLPSPAARWAALGLVLATAAAALAVWRGLVDSRFLLGCLCLEAAFFLAFRRPVSRVVKTCFEPCRDLSVLARMLKTLEAEQFSSPRLRHLKSRLTVDHRPPSRQVARLRFRLDMLEAQRNQLFAVISPLLLWGTQWAMAIEAWRTRYGPRLPLWNETAGEFEALLCLAAFSYEHPDYSVPELEAAPACFHGVALGHPLLPPGRCVCNEVKLRADQRALIVSGSNMSGKSTLLRTVGMNAVLALAGAPVFARRLRLSPLQVGASIQLRDSLREGTSRFFAEITRLKAVVDLAEAGPLLFLLDEVLHGTNSHDRLIGTRAVVAHLLNLGAIGLITTHDLALARIVDGAPNPMANVHFTDHLEEGRIRFDYLLRPGIVEKSNALDLMRSIGLRLNHEEDG